MSREMIQNTLLVSEKITFKTADIATRGLLSVCTSPCVEKPMPFTQYRSVSTHSQLSILSGSPATYVLRFGYLQCARW